MDSQQNTTEEKVDEPEDRSIESIQSEQRRQKIPKSLTFVFLRVQEEGKVQRL